MLWHRAPPVEPGVPGGSRQRGAWPAVCSGAITCSYLGDTHTKVTESGEQRSPAGAGCSPGDAPGRRGGPNADAGGDPRLGRCDGSSAAFCRRWGTMPRRGTAGGDWGAGRALAAVWRGGRSALETSCPGGCLLGHQLGSWGEQAHRGALHTHHPRGRCCGACSHCHKALEPVGATFLKTF